MKRYEIKLGWEIRDSRDIHGGYYKGVSTLVVSASNKVLAINKAIEFASRIPSSELERNGIDLEQYREKPYCTYYHFTNIAGIYSIKEVK